MAKMRSMQHNSRANSQGRVHGTKHNDRDFDTSKAENIDQEKSKGNVYWHLYQSQNPEMTFDEAELKYYVETFGVQLQTTNDAYLRQGHPERCKDMMTWKLARRNAPEETVMQIGKMEDHADPETLMACWREYSQKMEQWNQDHGSPFTLLTWALHVDEAVPHIQARRVWHYEDANGNIRVGQEKALAAAGVELPDPAKPEGKHNNRKMTFDAMTRELWLDVLHEHGLDIIREPVPNGKHNREKEQMIRDKYQDMINETDRLEKRKDELDGQLSQVEQQIKAMEPARRQAEEAKQQKEAAERQAAAARQEAVAATQAVQRMQEERDALKGEIEALRAEKTEIMTTAKVGALKGEKTALGGLRGVTYKEFEAMKRTAEKVDGMTVERDEANARAEAAERWARGVVDSANAQLREKMKAIEQDRPSLKAQQEIIQLRRENDNLIKENSGLRGEIVRLKNIVEDLVRIIREKLPEFYAAIMQPRQKEQPTQNITPQKPKSKSGREDR